jgi:hypothetical protein
LGRLGDAGAVGDQQHLAAARHHFLHVGDGLLEQVVVRRDHDHRHVSSISAIGPCFISPAA